MTVWSIEMGRPTKPTKIKKAQGTLQKCRTNQREPQPKKKQILVNVEIPLILQGKLYAIDLFTRITDYLISFGILSTINIDVVISYCIEANRYKEITLQLENEDIILSDGKINPLHTASNKTLQNMIKLACELGLTPATHSKLIATKTEEESDDNFTAPK